MSGRRRPKVAQLAVPLFPKMSGSCCDLDTGCLRGLGHLMLRCPARGGERLYGRPRTFTVPFPAGSLLVRQFASSGSIPLGRFGAPAPACGAQRIHFLTTLAGAIKRCVSTPLEERSTRQAPARVGHLSGSLQCETICNPSFAKAVGHRAKHLDVAPEGATSFSHAPSSAG
jgi:hypothetical protein